MGRIAAGAQRTWSNGDIVSSSDYNLDRSLLTTAINDNQDQLDALHGTTGAGLVGATAIPDLTGTTVQALLQSLHDVLKSTTTGTSGADFVSSAPITGVTGTTTYAQLASLKALIDAVYTKTQLDGGQLDNRYFTETELQSVASGTSGANLIKATPIATSPSDVQGILQWLYNQQASVVLGQIPDGSVTKPKLATTVANQLIDFAVTTGTANTYAITLSSPPVSYTDGYAVSFKVNVDSTAASTLNVNSLGAVPIMKSNGNAVTNLKANGVYTVRYNATTTNFILQGEGASGTATASNLLSGKTASVDAGDITGTMPNNGSVTITPSASNQTIPLGYHDGTGSVPGVVVPSANVLTGTTIAGTAGTMPNRGAMTITPGTSAQIIPTGYHNGSGTVVGDTNLIAGNILGGKSIFGVAGSLTNKVGSATVITPSAVDQAIPQGYFGGAVGDGKVSGDANLIAANIISGESIFGVAGTATIESLGGKKYASGTQSGSGGSTKTFTYAGGTQSAASPYVTVTGLTFKPSNIVMIDTSNYVSYWYTNNTPDGVYSGATIKATPYNTSFGNMNDQNWRADASPASVTSSGFTLPVQNGNGSFNWQAFE